MEVMAVDDGRWVRVKLFGILILMGFASSGGLAQEAQEDTNYLFIPGLLRLEGVGALYGAGVGAQKLFGSESEVYLGAAFGEHQGLGVMAHKIPIAGDSLKMGMFHVQTNQFRLETSYSRGFADEDPLYQKVQLAASGVAFDYAAAQHLKIIFGVGQSVAGFDGFETLDEEDIPLPGAFLPDVETLTTVLKLAYDSSDGNLYAESGFKGAFELKSDTGRVGQADQMTSTLTLSGHQTLTDWLVGRVRLQSSQASITSRKKQYESEAGVLEALKADCESLRGAELERCAKLRGQLVGFIAANNKYGSGKAIGGANSLRGFREQRFKAANTHVVSLEGEVLLSHWLPTLFEGRKSQIAFVPFYDLGYAADKGSEVFEESEGSWGASLRFSYDQLTLRLGGGQSADTSAWYFTVGKPW